MTFVESQRIPEQEIGDGRPVVDAVDGRTLPVDARRDDAGGVRRLQNSNALTARDSIFDDVRPSR